MGDMTEQPTHEGMPGDRPPREDARRILDRPPSERYAAGQRAAAGPADEPLGLTGVPRAPIVRAAIITALAAAAMVVTGGILATNGGLLFIAGLAGAASGLVLARVAVPGPGAEAIARASVVRGAVALAVGGVVAGAIGIWLVSRLQGGVLDPIDYFVQTSGALLPFVALVAAVTAAWGASAGPVES
jgi:hypothetical protein